MIFKCTDALVVNFGDADGFVGDGDGGLGGVVRTNFQRGIAAADAAETRDGAAAAAAVVDDAADGAHCADVGNADYVSNSADMTDRGDAISAIDAAGDDGGGSGRRRHGRQLGRRRRDHSTGAGRGGGHTSAAAHDGGVNHRHARRPAARHDRHARSGSAFERRSSDNAARGDDELPLLLASRVFVLQLALHSLHHFALAHLTDLVAHVAVLTRVTRVTVLLDDAFGARAARLEFLRSRTLHNRHSVVIWSA